MDLMERFSNAGVVPVVVLEDAGQALSTARALLAGGIDVMEITFRTDAARDAIQIVAEQCPDMLVGAGTVCSVEQCRQAAEAGARFIVSPGFDPCVVDWCLEHELTVLPGCVTPSVGISRPSSRMATAFCAFRSVSIHMPSSAWMLRVASENRTNRICFLIYSTIVISLILP